MAPASVDVKPRHLSLLFASFSLCIFFFAETYNVVSSIRKEDAIEAQSHRVVGPLIDDFAIDVERNNIEFTTQGVNEYNGKILAQGGENSNLEISANGGEKHIAEVVVHGGEASSDELMATGVEQSSVQPIVQNFINGQPSSGELMDTSVERSSVQSGVQSIINGHPYSVLRDIHDPVNLGEDGDIPLFWHIHKSGGSSMKHIFTCLRKVQTRRMNEPNICTDKEPILRICDLEFGSPNLGSKVINADISSIGGIQRAKTLGLTKAGTFLSPPDCSRNLMGGCIEQEFIVDTSRFYESLQVFTHTRKARLFILFRHPVERAISKYFYIKVATWERNYKPQVGNMTLLEYADSKLCYNNWITRRLVNKMEGHLTRVDLDVAKEILKRKTLILLLEDIDEAVKRLRHFFGWNTDPLDPEQHNCLKEHMHDHPVNVNAEKEYVEPGGPEWEAVKEKNLLDLELYLYSKELYQLQGQMIVQSYAAKSNLR